MGLKGLHYFWMTTIQPSPMVAARSKAWACWDCGFYSRRRHGCLSLMSVVCCVCRGVCDGLIARAEESSRMGVTEYDQVQQSPSTPTIKRYKKADYKKKRNNFQLLPRPTGDVINDSLADSILWSQMCLRNLITWMHMSLYFYPTNGDRIFLWNLATHLPD